MSEQFKTGALYTRVSTDKQEEISPDVQKRLLFDYTKKNEIIINNNSGYGIISIYHNI